MRKIDLFLSLLCFTSAFLSAQSYKDFLTLEEQNILVSGKNLQKSSFGIDAAKPKLEKSNAFLFLQNTKTGDFYLSKSLNKPDILVESLFLLPFQTSQTQKSEALSKDEILKIANIFCKVSTLKGIEYYSESRGKMNVLYESSYRIDAEKTKNLLPDLELLSLPSTLNFPVLQKDTTFGENIYVYVIETSDTEFHLKIINRTNLSYGILKLIDAEKSLLDFYIKPLDDAYLIYVASRANALLLPGFSEKIEASFSNRAKAIITWFSKKI